MGRNVLYGDQTNDFLFGAPGVRDGVRLEVTDRVGIDGAVDTTARAFGGLSTQVRRLQSGYLRSYVYRCSSACSPSVSC